MRPAALHRKLSECRLHPKEALPLHFSIEVLQAARKLRDSLRLHWRVLVATSFIALFIAALVAGYSGDSTHSEVAPPLRIFQATDQANPFVLP